MTCRAPTSSLSCGTTPTGQVLGYDPLGRLLTWQDATTNPLNTSVYGYDGSGSRVEQVLTNGAGTTTTAYIGPNEELSTTNGTTTTTTYYSAGPVTAVNVQGTLSYLAGDMLHSVSVALDGSGHVTASQLYAPYGQGRYSTGVMPTAKGFTGQRLDPSGLNYYNARYYDAGVGQFTSADPVQGPNRYAYVAGNPETMTDPSGKCEINASNGSASNSNSSVTSNLSPSTSPVSQTNTGYGISTSGGSSSQLSNTQQLYSQNQISTAGSSSVSSGTTLSYTTPPGCDSDPNGNVCQGIENAKQILNDLVLPLSSYHNVLSKLDLTSLFGDLFAVIRTGIQGLKWWDIINKFKADSGLAQLAALSIGLTIVDAQVENAINLLNHQMNSPANKTYWNDSALFDIENNVSTLALIASLSTVFLTTLSAVLTAVSDGAAEPVLWGSATLTIITIVGSMGNLGAVDSTIEAARLTLDYYYSL